MKRDRDELFNALNKSPFRRRFRLEGKELKYLRARGMGVVLEHARDFIEKRLAPASPENDGSQTPWRNHPVFVAQHATGSCCRGCLEKWHGIARGRVLQEDEKIYLLEVIREWLSRQERAAAGKLP